jgi:hypothetical protein
VVMKMKMICESASLASVFWPPTREKLQGKKIICIGGDKTRESRRLANTNLANVLLRRRPLARLARITTHQISGRGAQPFGFSEAAERAPLGGGRTDAARDVRNYALVAPVAKGTRFWAFLAVPGGPRTGRIRNRANHDRKDYA